MAHDMRQRDREVARSGCATLAHAVDEDKGVVAATVDLQCVREPFVECGHIGEATPRRDQRERCPRPATQEEQARGFQRRIPALLGRRVDVVEHRLAAARVVDQPVQRRHHLGRMHARVVRHQRADVPQRHFRVGRDATARQQQAGEPSKGRVLQQVRDSVVTEQVPVHGRRVGSAGGGARGLDPGRGRQGCSAQQRPPADAPTAAGDRSLQVSGPPRRRRAAQR